jgi:hypothetical protein
MRNVIKRSLVGLLVLGAMGAGVVGAEAMGGNANGPDAFVGIVGGSPQPYAYSPDDRDQRGFEANIGGYRNGYGAHGTYYNGHYNGN